MGGDHGMKIPDWKSFTVGEHTPELLKLQKMLDSLGLKDPWLRNEVWRYDRRDPVNVEYKVAARRALSRGVLPGLGLAIISAGIHYYRQSGEDHGHGHGHH
uniref:NADH dehydrogenase 1 beta subcomplex subunit 3 n=1 Tax=Pseudodiaptomus poplesia TaxID=213370 RepID=A0A1S6GL17_9MAXI|nr:NADH dehydrogenase 1 beta subcomplex subunit 3 [Pseudodiaptomus poplesia]